MAKTRCPMGHFLSNGDGETDVWAFRTDFFKDFAKREPDCVIRDFEKYWKIYDCVEEARGENLDCWYCEKCRGLTVFVDEYRYDFMPMDILPEVNREAVLSGEEYIAMRPDEFEVFQDYCDGMHPLTAIETFDFKYKYRLSKDKRVIYAINPEGEVEFGYERVNYTTFAPFGSSVGKYDLNVRMNMYVQTDESLLVIDEIIEAGKLYMGRVIESKGLPVDEYVEIRHEDILSVAEEICKSVIVE